MTLGTLNISGISLPIADCKSWRVAGTAPVCLLGLDTAQCDTCGSRVSREGNIIDPPLFAGMKSPPPAAEIVAPTRPAREPRLRGMGDVVQAMTKAVGIRTCGGCAKRREALNRMIPFGQKETSPPPEGNGEGEAK